MPNAHRIVTRIIEQEDFLGPPINGQTLIYNSSLGKFVSSAPSALGSITIGSTAISLGGSTSSLSGLTSITANSLSAVPVTGTSAGNSLTLQAGDASTSGAGGNIILQAGVQAVTGGDGSVIVRQRSTQTSNAFSVQSSDGLTNHFYINYQGYAFTNLLYPRTVIQQDSAAESILYNFLAHSRNNTFPAIRARKAASGTENIQEWQNSAGTVLSLINSSGDLSLGSTTVYGTGTREISISGSGADANTNYGSLALRNPTTNTFNTWGTVDFYGDSTLGAQIQARGSSSGMSFGSLRFNLNVSSVLTTAITFDGTSSYFGAGNGTVPHTMFIYGNGSGTRQNLLTLGISNTALNSVPQVVFQGISSNGTPIQLGIISALKPSQSSGTADGGLVFGTANNSTTATDWMYLTSLGRLGLKNSNPTYDLDVTGWTRSTSGFYANTIQGIPVTSGAGNSLTIQGGDGITSGAGGNLILQAGIQATTGGDGSVIIRQRSGQTTSVLSVQDSSNANVLTVSSASSLVVGKSGASGTIDFANTVSGFTPRISSSYGSNLVSFSLNNSSLSMTQNTSTLTGGVPSCNIAVNGGGHQINYNTAIPSLLTSYGHFFYTNTILRISTPYDATYIQPYTNTDKGLVVKGLSSQAGNLQEWQNSAGTVLSYFGSTGNLVIGNSVASVIPLTVFGTSQVNSALRYNMRLADDSALASGIGPGISFMYKHDGTNYVDAAGISAIKENATSGDSTTALAFITRTTNLVERMRITGAGNVLINTTTTNSKTFRVVGIGEFAGTVGTPTSAATADPVLLVSAHAHTLSSLSASTEYSQVRFNLGTTTTFGAGNITLQRAFYIDQPTYAFTSSSTITRAATMQINGAPIAGANAALTESVALRVLTGQSTAKGLVVQGAASQTANIFEVQDSANITVVSATSSLFRFHNTLGTGVGITFESVASDGRTRIRQTDATTGLIFWHSGAGGFVQAEAQFRAAGGTYLAGPVGLGQVDPAGSSTGLLVTNSSTNGANAIITLRTNRVSNTDPPYLDLVTRRFRFVSQNNDANNTASTTYLTLDGQQTETTQRFLLNTLFPGTKGLVVQGVASQTANLFELQNSAGSALIQMTDTGVIGFSGSYNNGTPAIRFGTGFGIFPSGTNTINFCWASNSAGSITSMGNLLMNQLLAHSLENGKMSNAALQVRTNANQANTNVFTCNYHGATTISTFTAGSVPLTINTGSLITIPNVVTNKELTSNVATITFASSPSFPAIDVGDVVVVSIGDPVFDGTYTLTAKPSSTQISYARTNANVASTAASGTVSYVPANQALRINLNHASIRGIVVRGTASQAANLLELQNSAGTNLFTVTSSGEATTSGGLLVTGSGNIEVTGTGNIQTIGNGDIQALGNGNIATFGSGDVGVAGSGGLGYLDYSDEVIQETSRTTSVTINTYSGHITLFSAAGSTSYQTFTVNNDKVTHGDVVTISVKSATNKYIVTTSVADGSFDVTFATTGGTSTDQPIFSFAIIKVAPADPIVFSRYSYDADAEAYILAAGLTDSTHINAARILVNGLKGLGLWTKMTAIYPFIGGSALSHSINMKTPGTYNITWFGSITHNSNGVTGDGTSGYGNTGITPSLHLQQNSISISAYSRTNSGAETASIGVQQGSNNLRLFLRNSTNNLGIANLNQGGNFTFSANDSLGFFVCSRTSSTLSKVYERGLLISSSSLSSGGLATIQVCILANNSSGVMELFNSRTHSFIHIGSGLTDAEVSSLSTLVQYIQTLLGRAV